LRRRPIVANDDFYPQNVIGNVPIDSSRIPFSVTDNDASASGPFTITAYDTTTANGGKVVMTTSGVGMGQFTVDPPAGFTGNDSFSYTIASGGGTSSGTVHLTIDTPIWFIDANGQPNGNGTLKKPFKTLAEFQAINDGIGRHPGPSQALFLYDNSLPYGGPLNLLPGQ